MKTKITLDFPSTLSADIKFLLGDIVEHHKNRFLIGRVVGVRYDLSSNQEIEVLHLDGCQLFNSPVWYPANLYIHRLPF